MGVIAIVSVQHDQTLRDRGIWIKMREERAKQIDAAVAENRRKLKQIIDEKTEDRYTSSMADEDKRKQREAWLIFLQANPDLRVPDAFLEMMAAE